MFDYGSRMPRPKQRTAELRDRLLAASVELLVAEGASGFTARNVASRATTSTAALYELFGDRAGLLREVFFEGFRALHRQLDSGDSGESTEDPRGDLLALVARYRAFVLDNRMLSEIMFSRPFHDFDPTADDLKVGTAVRRLVVANVKRCIDAGLMTGDATDISLVLVATVQGLADAEYSGRLGASPTLVNRRWVVALDALLGGFSPVQVLS
jgi:AcrR family transcriptional regulator